MTQASWLILALKIALISGFASLVAWVVLYSALASWWRNPIGRTLVAKTTLIAGLFASAILGMFFRVNPWIAGWTDVATAGLVAPVMLWRCAVWLQLHRAGRLPRNGHDGNEGQAG